MDRSRVEPDVVSIPGDRATQWIEYHSAVAAPSTHSYEFVFDITADSIGPFCTDVDGNVFLDFTSHIAATPLGYNNPYLLEKLAEFGHHHPTKVAGQNFYSSTGWPPGSPDIPGPTQLMHRLTQLTEPYGLDTVFLSNSGAEAVENAIKICYDHRNGAKYGITFQGAFHGRTLGALSLNRSKAVHRRRFPELPGIHDLPYCADRGCTAATCSCGFFPDANAPSRLRAMLDRDQGYIDPDELAYIIIEPVQGEGGYRFPSDPFADEITAVCNEHDVLLVADEIQTGIGRTGRWWGSDHFAFEPDVITCAKALQVGATIASEDVFPDERARISSTWGGGDLLAAMQGVLTIEVIEEENLLTNARKRGEQLKQRLRDVDIECLSNVRGEGLMVAVDFDTKNRLDRTIRSALEHGLLTLGCGRRTMRLLPPLDVTEREIDLGVDLLIEAIAAADPDGHCLSDPTRVL